MNGVFYFIYVSCSIVSWCPVVQATDQFSQLKVLLKGSLTDIPRVYSDWIYFVSCFASKCVKQAKENKVMFDRLRSPLASADRQIFRETKEKH